MKTITEVAVVGAGPFGLSIAAHLRQQGIDYRIFGVPMQSWRSAMPKGMYLKSEGDSSDLSDPAGAMRLANYCAANGLPYRSQGLPVSLENFVDYSLAFQRQFVPDLEQTNVVGLAAAPGGFEVRLETGGTVKARRVIVAVGTTFFARVPSQLSTVGPEFVSHTSNHADLAKFAGRDVVVIGGGQSSLETGALLHEQGAKVQILVRRPNVFWNPFPRPSTLWARLRKPYSALGAGWKNWCYCNLQGVFQYCTPHFRAEVVRRALGPAGAPWLKDRVVGRFPLLCGHAVEQARETGGKVSLSVANQNGELIDISADHVIAATGFKVDISLLPFLDPGLLQRLRSYGGSPVLSSDFESSVPDLYFTGLAAAHQFGPSMRFMFGADYAARKFVRGLKRKPRFDSANLAEDEVPPFVRSQGATIGSGSQS